MTGLIVTVLVMALAGVLGATLQIALIARVSGQGNPEDGSQPRPLDGRPNSPAGQTGPAECAWLPPTLPALPRAILVAPPRVCAGRVTRAELISAFYTAADLSARRYLAGLSWPAQEGMT